MKTSSKILIVCACVAGAFLLIYFIQDVATSNQYVNKSELYRIDSARRSEAKINMESKARELDFMKRGNAILLRITADKSTAKDQNDRLKIIRKTPASEFVNKPADSAMKYLLTPYYK